MMIDKEEEQEHDCQTKKLSGSQKILLSSGR